MAASPAVLTRGRPWSRVMGLTSVYAKTLLDSRRAALAVGLIAGTFMLGTGAPFGTAVEFSSLAARQVFANGILALPLALRGLLGQPIDIIHLGGFLSWRIGNALPLLFGLWSVLALSGTLAGEAGRGSLDLLASTPHSRRSIALQKVAGHVTALAVAVSIWALITWLAGQLFAKLPGDEISLGSTFGAAILFALIMLAAGSLAFATSPFVGRTRALAFGVFALFGSNLINSYSSLSPVIAALRPLSWDAWTQGHRPMAGVSDWPSVLLLALVCVGFIAIGILGFVRRDLGSATALRWLRLPSLPAGVGDPFRRQLADRTAVALGWGAGIGLYAGLIIISAKAFAESIGSIPSIVALIHQVYPDIDFSQPSGILQLAFFGFAVLMTSLAAAGFLSGWASDESGGRLAVVMAAPISRARWMIQSGLGVMAAIAIMTVLLTAMVAATVLSQGGEILDPVGGSLILGLTSAAFAGLGLAVGGVVRASLAAPVAAIAAIATFVLDLLGPALKLPDPILQLSLVRHMGQPMAGVFDPVGIVAAIVIAVGGLLIGAWGLQRRDLDR
jgi:ABC-2 type transport system permease protein